MAENNVDHNDNPKSMEEIIYPEIEPGIISKHMIEKSYLEEGYKGEEARLHRMEPVVYDRITSLRLDFKNILRIDHLWILPNLTKLALNCNKIEVIEHIDMLVNLRELDLSFNYIERIENLEKLVNLEVLSLFSNLITKIENLDTLEKLVILSIGNNLIKTTDGFYSQEQLKAFQCSEGITALPVVAAHSTRLTALGEELLLWVDPVQRTGILLLKLIERFRFLPNLKVLNLEGNPITHESNISLAEYVAAILPNVKYYEYVAIKDEKRENAKVHFYRELREIETNEEIELQARAQKIKEEKNAERLSLSFVEHLNEHQLFASLWKGDEDGHILMMVGEAAVDLAEEYDADMFKLTQEIYKLGLEKYKERQLEIEHFQSGLKMGHQEVQQMGRTIVGDFLQFKDKLFEEAKACYKYIEGRAIRGEDEDTAESIQYADRLDHITIQLDDMVNNVWQQLMSQELHLHEATEEIIIKFQRKMQEMIAKFVEKAQTYFSQLRDIAVNFSENLNEIVSRFVATKLAMQDFDGVPEPLRMCMEDRDAIGNIVAGMKDSHTQRIDEREDRLMHRSKEFVDNMIDKLNKDELERNRAKILEINTFLDHITENLQSMQQEIREELLNDKC